MTPPTPPAVTLALLASTYNMNGQHGRAITSAIMGIEPGPEMLGELNYALGVGLVMWEVNQARAGKREARNG